MIKKVSILFICLLLASPLFSQEVSTEEELDEVIITSSRIDLPFKENSRTITVITTAQIQKSTGSFPFAVGLFELYF